MPKKILIVDDDPDFTAMNQAVLENAGYSVMVAHNSRDGIGLIKTQKPDLLLLDVMMGTDVEGFDAVDKIRDNPIIKDIPIIMITAFSEHHEVPWAEKPEKEWVNVEQFLTKPVSPEVLISEVKRLVG
ncbi:MAG: response regulator [Firmicutes bacterium]|nr:response regulator [Bacillota bacterium]